MSAPDPGTAAQRKRDRLLLRLGAVENLLDRLEADLSDDAKFHLIRARNHLRRAREEVENP